MTTTERLTAGVYRVYDENGYRLATIRKADRRTRLWIITYVGGGPGGEYLTLKAAVHRVNAGWEE